MLMCVHNMNDGRVGVPQGLSLASATADCVVSPNCHQQASSETLQSPKHPACSPPPLGPLPCVAKPTPTPSAAPVAATTTTTTAPTTATTAEMVVDLTGFLHGDHRRQTATLDRGQIALLPVRLSADSPSMTAAGHRPHQSPLPAGVDPVVIGHLPVHSFTRPTMSAMCPAHTLLAMHQGSTRTTLGHCPCCPLSLSGTSRDSGFSEGVAYCDAFKLITTPVLSADSVNTSNVTSTTAATTTAQYHRQQQYSQRFDPTPSTGSQYYNKSSQLQEGRPQGNLVGSPQLLDCIICKQQQQLQSYSELLRHHHRQQQQIISQQQTTCSHCSSSGQVLSSTQSSTISTSSGVYENLAFQERPSGRTHIPRIVCHSPGLSGEVGVTPATTDSGISSPTLPDNSSTTPPPLSIRPDFHHGGEVISQSPHLQQQGGDSSILEHSPFTGMNIDHVLRQDLPGGGGSPTFQRPLSTSSTSDESSSAKTAMSSLSFSSDFGGDVWGGRRSSSPSGSSGDSSGDCSGSSVASWAQQFTGAAENAIVWKTLKVSTKRLSKCFFYYEQMSMEQAKLMLKPLPVGSFLLRDSSNKHYLFSLSAKTPRGVTSVRIEYRSALFRLDSDEKSASQMPGFDCVLKLIQHYVQLSENKRTKKCVWLESSGRKDTPVMLTRPATQGVPPLTHLCRKVIHKNVPMEKMTQNLKTDFTLLQYLREYPYYV